MSAAFVCTERTDTDMRPQDLELPTRRRYARDVRTILTIDDDLLEAARYIADDGGVSVGRPVRSSRQSDSPEINGLRGSNRGSAHRRVHRYWVIRQVASISPIRHTETSKWSRPTP